MARVELSTCCLSSALLASLGSAWTSASVNCLRRPGRIQKIFEEENDEFARSLTHSDFKAEPIPHGFGSFHLATTAGYGRPQCHTERHGAVVRVGSVPPVPLLTKALADAFTFEAFSLAFVLTYSADAETFVNPLWTELWISFL